MKQKFQILEAHQNIQLVNLQVATQTHARNFKFKSLLIQFAQNMVYQHNPRYQQKRFTTIFCSYLILHKGYFSSIEKDFHERVDGVPPPTLTFIVAPANLGSIIIPTASKTGHKSNLCASIHPDGISNQNNGMGIVDNFIQGALGPDHMHTHTHQSSSSLLQTSFPHW